MEHVIVTHGLTKYYGDKKVVDSLDLRIPKGSVYGFLGRNGAGKTTAIKMMLGLVHPDRGSAELFGEEVSNLSNDAKARIAYMAEGHPLYHWMTVGYLVDFTRAFYANWNGDLVDGILDHFELSKKQKIRHLPGDSGHRSLWPSRSLRNPSS
jgi:ABC-2 type transport system ATP-binding protein